MTESRQWVPKSRPKRKKNSYSPSAATTDCAMIERLLTPGSFPALAMRRYVLGKLIFQDISHSNPCSSLSITVAQADKRFANKTRKSDLRWCG